MKDFYSMRGNSTILLDALSGSNKASCCTSNVFGLKNTIARSFCKNKIADKSNYELYKLRILFSMLLLCLAIVFGGNVWGQTIDFESGVIPSEFTNDATYPWTVVSDGQAGFQGTYCIKSGNAGVASSTSTISITKTYTYPGVISFWGGCWGEGSSTIWDKCIFSIDGVQKFSYGALAAWNIYEYDVTAGEHTFTWSYSKDNSTNPTGDAFFVDNIVFVESSCQKPSDLTVNNITATTADISWTAGGSETEWTLKWGPAGFDVESAGTLVEDISTASYNLTGLTSNTEYDVYVKAVCSESDESLWTNFSFRTECDVFSAYPWSENFDGYTVSSSYNPSTRTLPSCWSAINTTSYASYQAYPSIYYYDYTDYSNTTPNCLRLYSYYSSYYECDPQPQYAILPAMENLAGKQITLNARGYDANSTFKIGTMTDPTDAATFEMITEQTLTTAYQEFIYTIPAEATAQYIAIMIDAADADRTTNSVYIDDLVVDLPPACPKPTVLAVVGVTAHTAQLSWTSNAAAWQICLNDDEQNLIDVIENPYTLTGLEPETSYAVKIRANCGGEYSEWTGKVSFTTTVACPVPTNLSCSNITAHSASVSWDNVDGVTWDLRYMNNSEADPHWTDVDGLTSPSYGLVCLSNSNYSVQVRANCGADGYSEWSSPVNFYTGYCIPAPTSVDGVGISNVTFGTGSDVVDNSNSPATSPYYGDYTNLMGAVQAGVEATVSITYATGYTYGTVIWIDLNDNIRFDPNEVVYVGESTNVNPTTLAATFTLPASTPTGDYRMRIAGADSYYNSNITSIADAASANSCPTSTYTIVHDYTIRVLDPPSCITPMALRATNITARSADLVWIPSGSETAWQICLNGDEANLIDVNTNPYVLENLLPSTPYAVKVRANCGDVDGVSAWSNSVMFVTLCETLDVPYTENFENFSVNTVPTCWDNSASGSSTLASHPEYIWGVYNYGDNNMLRMYNYFVQTGTALINSQPVSIPSAGQYQLTFDYSHTASCGDFVVKISQDGGSSFTDLESYAKLGTSTSNTDPGEFTEATISLVAYAGETIILQFYSDANYGSGAIFIDNVSIDEIPACDKPTAVTVDNAAITSATISWTAGGNEDTWNLGYKADGDADWTEISNVTTPYTIEDLTAETNYEVRVQANCRGNIGVSNWSRTVSFTTLPNCPAPNNLSVSCTATTAIVSWTAGFSETNWNLRYKAEADFVWTEISSVTNPYTIENLTAETAYEVQLQSKCSPIASSEWTNSYAFYTGYCEPAPTSRDGKGIIDVSFGVGDVVVNNSNSENGLPGTSPYYGNYTNLVGAVNAGLETTVSITYATGYTYGTIIWIDLNNNLVFDGNEIVYFGASTANNPTTLNATFTLPESTPLGDYRMRIAAADSYYDSNIVSLAEAESADPCPTTSYATVHDYTIRVIERPSCLPPANVHVENITTTGATISWTENGTASEWELQYSTSSDFSTYQTVNASTNPIEITGLTMETIYYVRVKANCGGDFSYWSSAVSFATACGIFTVDADHRFTEDFTGLTGATFPPLCWSQERTESGSGSSGAEYPDGAWSCNTSSQGTGSNPPMAMLRDSRAGSKHNLVTKALFMAAGDYLVSTRVYRNATGGSSQDEGINVYLSKTDDLVSVGNDAIDLGFISRNYAVESIVNPNIIVAETASGWYKYEIPITIESDGVYYVIFEGRSQYGSSTYMDDVVVKVVPTCANPTNLLVASTGLNDVTLEWTAGGLETSWNLRYKLSGENNWTQINDVTSPYTVTGLSIATSYDFQVQADCSGDHSEWTDAVTATTKYGIVFLEEFASTQPDDWNQYTGHLTNVMNGSATLASGSGWIFNSGNGVFDDHARVNIYGANCYRWLTTPIVVMEPNVQLTFDLALTAYSGTLQSPSTTGLDDMFVVLISTDEGATWTILRQYDNVGSSYVYNDISLEGDEVAIDLSSYGTDEVIIAFYGESTESNADNNLHIDNVMLDYIPTCLKPTGLAVVSTTTTSATLEWTPAGAEPAKWQYRLNGGAWTDLSGVTGTQARTATITGLAQATVYTVEVRAYCSDGFNDQSRPSTAVSFHTALCDGGDMCEIRYELADSDGDGWEGNAINVIDELTGIVLDTWTIADGEASVEGTLSVCNGREISFEWENGNSAEDCSYAVYDRNDEEIFSGEGAMTSTESYTVDCTVINCRRPRSLSVSNITATTARISWVPNGNIATWQYSIDNGANWTDVSGVNQINLTGLTAGQTYTVMLRTDCGNEQSEARSISFVTGDMCEVTYELTDSYGDGWNGASIKVMDVLTSRIIDTWTISSGNSASGSLSIIDGSEIRFVWVNGSYDSECSYVVKDVHGNTIFSGSNNMSSPVSHTVDCPDCARPRNVIASDVTTSSAMISWEAGSATSWTIQYSTAADFSTVISSEDVNIPQKEYTGLTTETTYYFRVKTVCGVGEESDWSNVCDATPSVCRRVGSGVAKNANLPSQSYYNNSLTQQIYTPAEIGQPGLMNGISFYNAGTTKTRSLDLYVVYTTKSVFSGSNDWIPVTAADKVFSGSVTLNAEQWTQIDFDNALEYDGTKNIAVIVDDNTGSYENGMSCLAFNAAGNQAIYVFNDATNYDPTNTSSLAGTLSSVKNQVRFCIEGCVDRTGSLAFVSPSAGINVGGYINLASNTYLSNSASPSGTIQWSSSDTRIATVNSEGVVTGVSAGRAIITATLPSVYDQSTSTLYCAMQDEFAVIVDCSTLVNPDCFDFEDYASANDLYYQDAGIPSCWRRIYTGTYDNGAPHAYNGYFAMDGNAIELTSGNYQLYGQNYGYSNYVVMPYISGLENGGMVTFNAWWQYVDYGTLTVGYMTDPDDAATFVAVDNATPFLYNFGSATAGLNQISLPNMPANAYIAFKWFCETDYFSYSVAIDNVCICSAVAGTFELTQTSGNVIVTQTFDDLSSFIRNETNVEGNITYSSSNPTVAIVDNNGIITGTSVGEATITVTFTPTESGKCPRTAEFTIIVGSQACKDIGTAATTTYSVPVNNKYNYTYSQILFRHDEIGDPGLITSISFQYAHNTPMSAKNSVKIYLKETDKEAFAGANDWLLDVTEEDLVYSGALNCSAGWNSYFLDEPFPYNGDNLVLVIDDNSANSNGEDYVFNYTETEFSSVISYYNDNNNYGNNNISGHSRICENTRPNTRFCIYEGSACTIVYDAGTNCLNGVSGTIENTHGVTGYPVFVTSEIPSCSTGLFKWWNTEADGSGTTYQSGAFIPSAPRDTLVLYAIYRICDYVNIVKAGNVQQGIEDGGADRFGVQKFNVCQGETIELEAQKKDDAPDNISYYWDVNRHDGHAHVTSSTSSISYTASNTMGHDILLTIDGHDGCRQEIPLRVWVSDGLRMTMDNPSAGEICVGNGKEIIVGDPRVVPDAMIEVANEALEIKSTQGVSTTKFIPDGVGECYTSEVTFADFKENAVITDASNIDFVKINMEHSHIGDVQISLKCYTPNYEPRTAILLQDQKNTSGGGLDNATYTWPYLVVRCYARFDRYINNGYSGGTCEQGRLDRQNVNMAVYVGYDNTSTGVRQEARAFDRNMTIGELLEELKNMLNNTANNANRPADFCSGGYYYKFRNWAYNANYYNAGSGYSGGYGSYYASQWYTEAASLGFGKPEMHDGLGNYILTSSYNPEGEGFDYCWSNSEGYQYAAADGNPIDNANHERGYTNSLIVKPSNVNNGTQFYHPYQSFQSLVGCKLNGVWTIQICDSWGLDNGYIFSWEIGLKDIDDNAWSYDVMLVDSHMGNCGGFDDVQPSNAENLISEETGTPNFYIHPTLENLQSNGITLPSYPDYLTRSCELTLVDNIGCETTGNAFTYNISQPAIPNVVSPDICLGEQAHVSATLGGTGVTSGDQSMFRWWTLPEGETDWIPLAGQGITNPVSGVTSTEFSYVPTRSGDRFRAEIYDAHGCGGIVEDIIITNLPDLANASDYDYVWHGKTVNTTSSDWNTATNWYVNNGAGSYSVGSASLPTTADNVYIGESQCTKTTSLTLSDNAFVKNLTLGTGASLTVTAGTALNIAGDLDNVGTLNANEVSGGNESFVAFVGSEDQSISNAQTFRNVEFLQSGAGIHKITADNGITVDGSATFTKGILTGDATFNEEATASVRDFNSYIDGMVVKKGNPDSFTFPTGNDGVLGAFTTKIENNSPAGMSVKFNHKNAEDDQSGFSTEAPDYYPRWWSEADMCSENEPQLDHVSNFEYWKVDNLDANTNLTKLTLKVDADHPTQHFHDGISDYSSSHIVAAAHYDCWKNLGMVSTTVTGSHNTITIRNIPSIPRTRSGNFDGIVTLGSIDRATLLPIELVAFKANCDGRSTLVEWTTATERNNDYFVVERSDDAVNFVEVGRVAGAGNSIEPINYNFTDYGIHEGDNYYRLVQVDYDGARSVSEIVVAFCIEGSAQEPEVMVYPNPFSGELTVELDNFGNRPTRVDVFDLLGKLVYTEEADAPRNSYQMLLHLDGLPSSTYTVRVSTSDFVISRKVVKN